MALAAGQCGCRMVADGQNLDGVRLVQQGQYDMALQRFQQALASDPRNPDAYYNLAATYHRVGTERKDSRAYAQAETLYNQCLDLNENHVDCHRGLAVLLVETGRSDRAIALMKNWVAINPQTVDGRIELARLYEEFGDLEAAKLNLQQAVTMDQHNARAWAALGKIREEMGDPEQALANYQRSYGLNSFQPAVAQRIAQLSQTMSRSNPASDTRIVTRPVPNQF